MRFCFASILLLALHLFFFFNAASTVESKLLASVSKYFKYDAAVFNSFAYPNPAHSILRKPHYTSLFHPVSPALLPSFYCELEVIGTGQVCIFKQLVEVLLKLLCCGVIGLRFLTRLNSID